MEQDRTYQKSVLGHTACFGVLICVVVCGVMGAGCTSLPFDTAIPSFEEKIVITTGSGNVASNHAIYPVTVENTGDLTVNDVFLQADLLDVTGGSEMVLASQEIDAGSYDPKEVRTVNVEFKLIKLTGKNVEIRVTRMGEKG
ncbi:hypothetical protein L0665_04960 [Methanogenium marinum]|uniref:Uncharacterized protein n=1 Tax=Methanogenium marinum TaxID=348610 RepID=A0A9Q4KTI7_9EURY|nr:hypothetical protein [Methanogenium marinum]MDE4907958.1 hypothetical protein [Methanogenium marinum]